MKDMPTFLEEELHEPFHTWKADPNPDNTAAYLKAIDPILSTALKSYAGGQSSSTLKSHAKLMALDASKRYDPSRAKLRTHLMTQLQPLRRTAIQSTQPVHLPEKVSLHLYRLHHAENELRDQLGRDPSTAELADHSGLSLKRIAHLRRARPTYAEGQLMGPNEEGQLEPFSPAITNSDDKLWNDFVFSDLEPTDQFIMEASLGMHGHKRMKKGDIARKLRLTPGAVSQRAAKIQALLDQREELGHFL